MSHIVDAGDSIENDLEKGNYADALLKLRCIGGNTGIESWKIYSAYSMCYFMLGYMKKAAMYSEMAMAHFSGEISLTQRTLFSNYLMQLHYLSQAEVNDKMMFEKHCMTDTFYGTVQPYKHNRKKRKEKLRIGYLSPDFYEHIVVNFAIQLLARYDKERYEVVCYTLSNHNGAVTEQIKGFVDEWSDLSAVDVKTAARRIYADQIDILFDLAGHTEGGITLEIMAYKPAPIQISGIGWFDTTGLRTIDYFLTDIYCDGKENNRFFTEKLLRLPHTHFCYTPFSSVAAINETYRMHDTITFGSFNNFKKITKEMLMVWLKIVQAVPCARLLLKNSKDNSYEVENLRAMAKKIGFLDGQIEVQTASNNYLKEYAKVDIALDTYPYPGGGTTCEALYMGVPVISLYGTRHGSRFGYSILQNIGLGELAVTCIEEYIQTAVALAMDRELLLFLHQHLRSMMQKSPLMDAKNYVAEVESCYAEIWEKYLQG